LERDLLGMLLLKVLGWGTELEIGDETSCSKPHGQGYEGEIDAGAATGDDGNFIAEREVADDHDCLWKCLHGTESIHRVCNAQCLYHEVLMNVR
jgi:hypothetical protein